MSNTKNIAAKIKFTVNGRVYTYHAPQGRPGSVCWQDDQGDWDGCKANTLAEAKRIAEAK